MLAVALVAVAALMVLSCGQSSIEVSFNPPRGTVSVSVSDPPSCRFPRGDFKNVFVSIRSVQANISADENTNNWVELAPQLASNPVQIDLLAVGQNQCILRQLSQQVSVPVGDYQQIRLVLVPNNPQPGAPVPSPNACGTAGFNCAVLADNSIKQLNLNSQDITGLKIPPGQIVGGPIRVEEGQHVDINIDFNTCASIVRQGNGEFRLKPTLTAGQVSQVTTGISGTVFDSATQQPITGQVLVTVQQADSAGFGRIVMQTAADATGGFNFCPLPTGMYDVVAAAVDSTGTAYNATVVFSIPAGTSGVGVPLVKEAAGPATIQGLITSRNGAGVSIDAALAAFQPVERNGTTRFVSIPLLGDSTAVVATEPTPTTVVCPAGTFCAQYTLIVPASNPSFGTFTAGGTTLTTPVAGDVLYTIEAHAFKPMSGGTPVCSPSAQTTDKDSADQPLKVTGGTTTTAKQIDFTGCS
jgi:hypothetical protein